ncbi:MAG: hypothetical protein ACR2J7_02515 [Luteimonas sp.]
MLGESIEQGQIMIRTLSLAVLAAVALSGCVTSGYGYRGGSGDYYHGRSSPGYYGYGAPYGSIGYGTHGAWYGGIGYGSTYYRGPYPYGYGPYYRPGYGGYYGPYYRPYHGPYYPPYRRPVVVHPGHPHKPRPPHVERPDHPDRPPRTGIPWRDLDELNRPRPGMPIPTPARPEVAQSPPPRMDVRARPILRELREGRSERRGRAGDGSGNTIDEETP